VIRAKTNALYTSIDPTMQNNESTASEFPYPCHLSHRHQVFHYAEKEVPARRRLGCLVTASGAEEEHWRCLIYYVFIICDVAGRNATAMGSGSASD
jgi:hypothetical protein